MFHGVLLTCTEAVNSAVAYIYLQKIPIKFGAKTLLGHTKQDGSVILKRAPNPGKAPDYKKLSYTYITSANEKIDSKSYSYTTTPLSLLGTAVRLKADYIDVGLPLFYF